MNPTIHEFDCLREIIFGNPTGLDSMSIFSAMNRLASQITADGLNVNVDTMRRFFNCQGILFLVELGGSIVGMATLIPIPDIDDLCGEVDNVVIDSRFRGRGYSRLLMEIVIRRAKREGMSALQLTSKPSRIEANHLYPNMGFKKRETNVYRLNLSGA